MNEFLPEDQTWEEAIDELYPNADYDELEEELEARLMKD